MNHFQCQLRSDSLHFHFKVKYTYLIFPDLTFVIRTAIYDKETGDPI